MNITIQKALPPYKPTNMLNRTYLDTFKNQVLLKFPDSDSRDFAMDYFRELRPTAQKHFLTRILAPESLKKSMRFLRSKDENNFRFINTLFTTSHNISRDFPKRIKKEQSLKLQKEISKLYING